MQVTKRYCDICGREIPEWLHQGVEIVGHTDMDSGVCGVHDLEVCRECGVEFFKLLHTLKSRAAERGAVENVAQQTQAKT